MNILIILFILALVALFVPPLLGITTITAKPGTETNMQVGSVAYGMRESLNNLQPGDTIITNTENETWLYEITQMDASTGELTVRTSETAEPRTITLRRTASKKILVVPYIGYIVIALQTTEGMIILGLAVALLVILFIIADILCRKSKEKEEDEEEDLTEEEQDRQYFSDLAASQSRPSRLDELGTISIPPVADMMQADPEFNRAKTLELDEELETPELILESVASENDTAATDATQKVVLPVRNQAAGAAADAVQEAAEEITVEEIPAVEAPVKEAPAPKPAAEPAKEAPAPKPAAEPAKEAPAPKPAAEPAKEAPAPKPAAEETVREAAPAARPQEPAAAASYTSELSGIGSALENALNTDQINQTPQAAAAAAPVPEAVPEAAPEEIELAIPQRSLDELLQEAYANGEDPKVTKDPAIGVTFVDYSNCL